jgi:hypothetical protein
MGYSHRKAPAPDLPAAERYYDAALRLQPQHRGALEYSGELFLMRGDLARAEERLGQLDKACRLPCEEYTDLKKASLDTRPTAIATLPNPRASGWWCTRRRTPRPPSAGRCYWPVQATANAR